VQVDPFKPTEEAPVSKSLKLQYEKTLSNVVFKFNSRHYNMDDVVLAHKDGVTVTVALAQPRSRGTVKLASTDPLQQPQISLNLLADPADRATMVGGIDLACAIMGADHSMALPAGPNSLSAGRGLHSSTSQLNASALCGIGGACRGCLGVV